jgi:hypothetical protein
MNNNSGEGNVSKFFTSISKHISNSNVLNYSMSIGKSSMDIPYAVMGLVTVIVSTFTYVTYSDYINSLSEEEDTNSSEVYSNYLGTNESDEEPDNTSLENKSSISEVIESVTDNVTELMDNKVDSLSETEQLNANEDETEQLNKKDETEPGEKYTLGGKKR